MKYLGFCGSMGSGKTTAAMFLRETSPSRVVIASFAEPIKQAARIIGDPRHLYNLNKQDYVPILAKEGITWRKLYQLIGTDFGRNMLSQDIWIRWMELKLKTLKNKNTVVIFDDVRFDNEAEFIRALGGKVYRIVRNDLPLFPESYHASEHPLKPDLVDGIIENNGTINDFHKKLISLIVDIDLFTSPEEN